jgi:hypothetical protein
MPTLRTKYVALGAGVYFCRRGDAIHIVTTGDNMSPDTGKVGVDDGTGGSSEVMAKSNWISDQEISVEQFRDVVATVAPDYGGVLVNVGTEERPLLLTQQQAAIHGDIVASAAEALVEAAAETAIPVKP